MLASAALTPLSLAISTSAASTAVQKRCIADSWDLSNVTLAAVRAAPQNWPSPIMNKNWTDVKLDLNGTLAQGISYIERAAANGARLIAFLEVTGVSQGSPPAPNEPRLSPSPPSFSTGLVPGYPKAGYSNSV